MTRKCVSVPFLSSSSSMLSSSMLSSSMVVGLVVVLCLSSRRLSVLRRPCCVCAIVVPPKRLMRGEVVALELSLVKVCITVQGGGEICYILGCGCPSPSPETGVVRCCKPCCVGAGYPRHHVHLPLLFARRRASRSLWWDVSTKEKHPQCFCVVDASFLVVLMLVG